MSTLKDKLVFLFFFFEDRVAYISLPYCAGGKLLIQ